MSEAILSTVVQSLKLAVFQRDHRGHLCQVGGAPDWLARLWPQSAAGGGELKPEVSQFLENFLIDAANCWRAGGEQRVSSGPWVEKDSQGTEHHLQATAFTAGGSATLIIEELEQAFQERSWILQKAHEAALAYERLQQAEHALAEEKRLLAQRVEERTAELVRANDDLRTEVATRRRYAERLQAMSDIDRSILAAQSPEAIAEAALRRLHRLLPSELASVVELDSESRRGTILASFHHGERTVSEGWPLSSEQLLNSRTLRSGRPHRVRRTRNLFHATADGPAAAKVWQFILDLPMVAEGTLIGVLTLATDAAGGFTTEHEETALEIAAQLAVAIRQARLFNQVSVGREQLRALSLRLVEVQEAERQFLARELHDEIGQVLTGLKLSLVMSTRAAPPGAAPDLGEALGLLDELMQRVRQLSLDLRPQMLDDFGLLPALEWQLKRYAKQTGVQVHFQHTPLPARLPRQLETAVFRIVQEALTNVARHAGVAEATVRLWTADQQVGVQVEDRGAGFDAARVVALRASSGLAGMQERAELLGGQFTLDSAPGAGTRLTVELPMPEILPSGAAVTPSEATP